MALPSNAIIPEGSYLGIGVDFLVARTALAGIGIYTDGGTAYFTFDGPNSQIKINTIAEFGSGSGVTIDGLLLKDNCVGSSGAPATNIFANSIQRPSGTFSVIGPDAVVLNHGSDAWSFDATAFKPYAVTNTLDLGTGARTFRDLYIGRNIIYTARQTYTTTSVSTSRSLNPTTDNLQGVGNVLGTLIADLRTLGVLG